LHYADILKIQYKYLYKYALRLVKKYLAELNESEDEDSDEEIGI